MQTIKPSVLSHLNEMIQDHLFEELNQAISEDFPGHNEIIKGLQLDWQLSGDPQLTEKSLDFGIKGLFYRENRTLQEP